MWMSCSSWNACCTSSGKSKLLLASPWPKCVPMCMFVPSMQLVRLTLQTASGRLVYWSSAWMSRTQLPCFCRVNTWGLLHHNGLWNWLFWMVLWQVAEALRQADADFSHSWKVFFLRKMVQEQIHKCWEVEEVCFFIWEVKNWFWRWDCLFHFWLICAITIVEKKVNVVNAFLLGIGVLITDQSHSFFTLWQNRKVWEWWSMVLFNMPFSFLSESNVQVDFWISFFLKTTEMRSNSSYFVMSYGE